jgi:hypothetical protein
MGGEWYWYNLTSFIDINKLFKFSQCTSLIKCFFFQAKSHNGIMILSFHYKIMWFLWFLHTKSCNSWHVWGKLFGFIHYNIQYVVFIVAYITLKWKLEIRQWHTLGEWTNNWTYESITKLWHIPIIEIKSIDPCSKFNNIMSTNEDKFSSTSIKRSIQ